MHKISKKIKLIGRNKNDDAGGAQKYIKVPSINIHNTEYNLFTKYRIYDDVADKDWLEVNFTEH